MFVDSFMIVDQFLFFVFLNKKLQSLIWWRASMLPFHTKSRDMTGLQSPIWRGFADKIATNTPLNSVDHILAKTREITNFCGIWWFADDPKLEFVQSTSWNI